MVHSVKNWILVYTCWEDMLPLYNVDRRENYLGFRLPKLCELKPTWNTVCQNTQDVSIDIDVIRQNFYTA